MDEQYDIDCTGTEGEVIQHEAREARARYRDRGAFAGSSEASQIACWIEAVGPLVRIILALLAAIGAKSVREALARAKALPAPVDVEAEIGALAEDAHRAGHRRDLEGWQNKFRPLVEGRARLAREVERLDHRLRQMYTAHHHEGLDAQKARADAARLTAERDGLAADLEACGGELQTCRATLAEERADVDRLGQELAAARAEIARLTAELADVRASYQARETDWRAGRVRLDPSEAPAPFTAAPWERAWLAFVQACGYTQPIERLSMGWVIELAKAKKALRAALAAVEQACQPTVEMRLEYTATASTAQPVTVPLTPAEQREIIASAPGQIEPRDAVTDAELADAERIATVLDVDATSSEGDRAMVDIVERLARAEQARREAARKQANRDAAYQEHVRRRLAARAEQRPACCAAILSNMRDVRRSAVLGWCIDDLVCKFCPFCGDPMPGTEARRAAPASSDVARIRAILAAAPYLDAQQTAAVREIVARLDEPAMTADRAREVDDTRRRQRELLATDLRGVAAWHEQQAKGASWEWHTRAASKCYVAADAVTEPQPTPPRALTEDEARRWGTIVADALDGESHSEATIVVGWALHAASRGNVPPEVRPVATPDTCGHGTLSSFPCELCEAEMAVTTGEEQWTPKPRDRVRTADELTAVGYGSGYLRRPGIAGVLTEEHSEGGWWVRHDDDTEAPYDTDELRPVTTGAPSIAGPAGLDLASGSPPGYWEKGAAVKRQARAAQCVAVLVEDTADRVLLVLSNKGGDRGWELPGGKVEDGEDPRAAARREVIEETGLAVVLSEDEPTVLPATERHRGALLFRGRAEGEPRPGSDATEARWMPPGEVMRLYRGGRLSDLASRDVLVEWAGGGLSPAADATTHGPEARPRVGAWIAWEPACGASIYDDHGLVVASVWEAPDGWRWLARRRRITGHLGR